MPIIIHSPYYLLLFLPLIYLVIQIEFRRQKSGILFGNAALLRNIPVTFKQRLAKYVPYLLYAGIALWIVALARPQYGKEQYRIRGNGIALMMCVDRSGSMAAIDFEINGKPANRLDAVKQTFRDFVAGNTALAGRQDDYIGLLAFGGYVDTHCPLTLDHTTLLEMLNQIQLPQYITAAGDEQQGSVPIDKKLYAEESATAIGDAVAQAVDRLKDVPSASKVIILLSDGEQTFGTLTPQEGAETAKAFGIKIYTIGIGSNGETPFLATDRLGNKHLASQHTSIDEAALTDIAGITGGSYYNARNTAALEQVYEQIDRLEKTLHEGRKYTQYGELYRYPLLLGLLFIGLSIVLHCGLRRV
ncbi:MAG: VWA domain-containing protein [Planctomycetaceae bacterium]|nr:VWA domain-containing protein [Planctomycetaceae bacterium]